ncbi:hypothetical protein V2J09_022820 [Rumex salicifolius]
MGAVGDYEYSFKVLMVGDSGVGKSSLLLSFTSSSPPPKLSPTVGVDFKIKHLAIAGKTLKLTIWDTARSDSAVLHVLVNWLAGWCSWAREVWDPNRLVLPGSPWMYDLTNRETFTNLRKQWAKEVELYSTEPQCVKIVVGNKADREKQRQVSREEGIALATDLNCAFYECSAKTTLNVTQCFNHLTLKILEAPPLLQKGRALVKKQQTAQNQTRHNTASCCCFN